MAQCTLHKLRLKTIWNSWKQNLRCSHNVFVISYRFMIYTTYIELDSTDLLAADVIWLQLALTMNPTVIRVRVRLMSTRSKSSQAYWDRPEQARPGRRASTRHSSQGHGNGYNSAMPIPIPTPTSTWAPREGVCTVGQESKQNADNESV